MVAMLNWSNWLLPVSMQGVIHVACFVVKQRIKAALIVKTYNTMRYQLCVVQTCNHLGTLATRISVKISVPRLLSNNWMTFPDQFTSRFFFFNFCFSILYFNYGELVHVWSITFFKNFLRKHTQRWPDTLHPEICRPRAECSYARASWIHSSLRYSCEKWYLWVLC